MSNFELQIVVDSSGVKCVRIVGNPENHKSGHELYLKLQDLIKELDTQIQQRLQREGGELNA